MIQAAVYTNCLFFSLLNNILLYGHTIDQLAIYLLKCIRIVSTCLGLWQSCYENGCICFYININVWIRITSLVFQELLECFLKCLWIMLHPTAMTQQIKASTAMQMLNTITVPFYPSWRGYCYSGRIISETNILIKSNSGEKGFLWLIIPGYSYTGGVGGIKAETQAINHITFTGAERANASLLAAWLPLMQVSLLLTQLGGFQFKQVLGCYSKILCADRQKHHSLTCKSHKKHRPHLKGNKRWFVMELF